MAARRRILIVDDEPMLLRALARSFFPFKATWETKTATSGAEALQLLGQEHFDVVISDMRMPEMEGDALLEEVKRRHPHTVRMIHSGEATDESRVRALGTAHQFLSKPWNVQQVQESLARIFGLIAQLADESVREATSGISVLPSQAQMLEKLRLTLANERSSSKQLADLIATDVGLTAKLLQTVNSPFFGISRRITKVEEAINFLGVSMVRSVAQATQVMGSFGNAALVDEVQRRSAQVAQVAKHIAPGASRDDCFTAAMLHDVGRLVMATLKAQPATPPEPSHVGAYLLQTWGLPWAIVEAVASYSLFSFVVERPLSLGDMVAVARMLVDDPAGTKVKLLQSPRFAGRSKDIELWESYALKQQGL